MPILQLAKPKTDVERWRASNDEEFRPPYYKLIMRLTAIAPDSAVVINKNGDPHIKAISQLGKLLDITGRKVVKGMSNQCHANTAKLFSKRKIDFICTGYALAEDMGWRSHTWGLLGGKIIETTHDGYKRYFGVRLEGKSATQFVEDNTL